jgi:hypothetical protein
MIRRMRTLLPTYLSTGLGAFDISGTPREQAERKRLQLGDSVSQRHDWYLGGASECECRGASVN